MEERRVLLVEDDPLVASTLNFLLTRAGAITTLASSHAEAMASLHEPTTPPELLICDFDLDDALTGPMSSGTCASAWPHDPGDPDLG
ncbi:MAG: response regulator [Burkholderiaceae bacterium]